MNTQPSLYSLLSTPICSVAASPVTITVETQSEPEFIKVKEKEGE